MKKVLFTLLTYVSIVFVSTIFFIALFHTPFFKDVDVFFYRGCFFIIVASLLSVFLMFLTSRIFKSLCITARDCFAILFLFSGLTLGWFVLGPVTVERSISVFMLSYMDENDEKALTSEEFGDIFYKKYITDFDAFEKRFHEQLVSGNIVVDQDGAKITNHGRVVVNSFRLCSKLFNTEKWLVYPNEYGTR